MRTARAWSTSNVTRSRWFTPTSVAPAARARSSSASSWTSTSASRPSSAASVVEVAELAVVERGDDQQHGVGAHQPGVAHVVRRDGEVLAQHRQPAHGPGRGESAGEPPKNSPSVSTDRQAAPPSS